MKSLQKYKGFKVGDKVTIINKPTIWSSACYGTKKPLDVLKFPYTGKILEIKQSIAHIAINIDGYGFTLSYTTTVNNDYSLIETNNIIKSSKIKKKQYTIF